MNSSKRRKKLSTESEFSYVCGDGTWILCRCRRKKGVKNIYLKFKSDKIVELSAPLNFRESEMKRLLAEKEVWIIKRVERFKEYCRSNPENYFEGCRLWYLGERYCVEYEKEKRTRLLFEDGRFLYSSSDASTFAKSVESFYRKSAQKILTERLDIWSQKMGLYPKEIKFRRYKSRWGCCTHDNVITLNISLMRYDLELIDYVIVHELAHIRFKHHRKEFWDLVASFVPNFKKLRERLV